MPDFTPTSFTATRAEPGFVGWSDNGPLFRAAPEPADMAAATASGNPWWPRASRIQLAPTDGGSMLDYPPRGLWHTTETLQFPSYATGSFPHLTLGMVSGRVEVRQHIPFTRAARALRNESGGVQTNRARCYQVEILAFAERIGDLQAEVYDVLAEWAAWMEGEWGVPRTCGVTLKPYPASYGRANGVRLSAAEWERYSGWLGHQSVPENLHGDPGALDWRPILQPAEDDMNDADRQWIESRLDAHTAELTKKMEALYRLAARGEYADGTTDPASSHYADSVRGTREAILDALPEPPA
jgi:hypothetical protein